MMTVDEYENLCRYLKAPAQTVLTAHDLAELFCPHTPRADEDSPDLTDVSDVPVVLDWLDPVPRVICALTAAEMVLPVWDEWAAKEAHNARELPAQLLARVWLWVEGSLPANALFDDAARVRSLATMTADLSSDPVFGLDTAQMRAARVASNAVRSAFSAAHAVTEEDFAYAAVQYAAATAPRQEPFLRLWWARCRCRLAVADAATLELQ